MKNTLKVVAALICAAIVLVSCSDNSSNVLQQNTDNYDFIFEIVNNSGDKLTVSNYVRDKSVSDFNSSIITKTDDVELAAGESYQFKYNVAALESRYSSEKTLIGCYIYYDEQEIHEDYWESSIEYPNWKRIITILLDAGEIKYTQTWNKINISGLAQNADSYDFIYEVVNNTSGTLSIANYLRNSSINNYYDSFIARSAEFITLAVGETYQYKYNLTELKKTYLGSSLSLGCYFYPSGKWQCSGWENDLTTTTNQKHTVTVTDASSDYCMNGENTWSNLQ